MPKKDKEEVQTKPDSAPKPAPPPKVKAKDKGVETILFDLFKARLEEYLQNNFITKGQFNEILEYEKAKIK